MKLTITEAAKAEFILWLRQESDNGRIMISVDDNQVALEATKLGLNSSMLREMDEAAGTVAGGADEQWCYLFAHWYKHPENFNNGWAMMKIRRDFAMALGVRAFTATIAGMLTLWGFDVTDGLLKGENLRSLMPIIGNS